MATTGTHMRQPAASGVVESSRGGAVMGVLRGILVFSLPFSEESGVYHARFASSRSMVMSVVVWSFSVFSLPSLCPLW